MWMRLTYFFLILNQSKLIQQDVDALNTELMESSLTDLSMLSFFEHFHISPIKVCNREIIERLIKHPINSLQ